MFRSIDENISDVETIFGRVFNDKSYCASAIQMQDNGGVYLNYGGADHHIAHNRCLELMGDRVMDVVLCQKWFQARDADGYRNPIASWAAMRSSLVDNAPLGERGLALGLNAIIVANPGTAPSYKMRAATFEAIIGAVFFDAGDQGLQAVHDVLEHIGFFTHPLLSLPDMEDSRKRDKRNSGVAYENEPRTLLAVY